MSKYESNQLITAYAINSEIKNKNFKLFNPIFKFEST